MEKKIFTQAEFTLLFEALSRYSIEIHQDRHGGDLTAKEENKIQESIKKLEDKLEKI